MPINIRMWNIDQFIPPFPVWLVALFCIDRCWMCQRPAHKGVLAPWSLTGTGLSTQRANLLMPILSNRAGPKTTELLNARC